MIMILKGMSICCLSNAHRGKLMVNLDFSELVSNLLVVLRASNYENEKNELIFEYDYNENLEKIFAMEIP